MTKKQAGSGAKNQKVKDLEKRLDLIEESLAIGEPQLVHDNTQFLVLQVRSLTNQAAVNEETLRRVAQEHGWFREFVVENGLLEECKSWMDKKAKEVAFAQARQLQDNIPISPSDPKEPIEKEPTESLTLEEIEKARVAQLEAEEEESDESKSDS